MSTLRYAFALPLFVWLGCNVESSSTDAQPEVPEVEDDAATPTHVQSTDLSKDPEQFASVYSKYLGPDTPGKCGDSGCHDKRKGGFLCGATQTSCYEGLIAADLIDPANPEASTLADPENSPLAWYGKGGSMPKGAKADKTIANAITVWVQAGAKNDASTPDAGTKDAGKPTDASLDASTDSSITDAGADVKDASKADGGKDASVADASTAPTWTTVYTLYFGAGTPGHCGDSGCHSVTKSGFKCGTSKDTCYAGLIAAGLVNPTSPSTSVLGSTSASPLTWFGGSMPPGGGTSSAAKSAITAWLKAGAQNN